MDARLTEVAKRLKWIMTDPILPVAADTRNVPETTLEREALAPSEAPYEFDDLAYLTRVTHDAGWTAAAERWKDIPLDLRWLCVATKDRTWLAYKSLYNASPLDLRYAAVLTQDPRWLHNQKTWVLTPLHTRLVGINRGDPAAARPKFTDVSFSSYLNRIERGIPKDPCFVSSHEQSTSLLCACCPMHCPHDEDRPLKARMRFQVKDVRYVEPPLPPSTGTASKKELLKEKEAPKQISRTEDKPAFKHVLEIAKDALTPQKKSVTQADARTSDLPETVPAAPLKGALLKTSSKLPASDVLIQDKSDTRDALGPKTGLTPSPVTIKLELSKKDDSKIPALSKATDVVKESSFMLKGPAGKEPLQKPVSKVLKQPLQKPGLVTPLAVGGPKESSLTGEKPAPILTKATATSVTTEQRVEDVEVEDKNVLKTAIPPSKFAAVSKTLSLGAPSTLKVKPSSLAVKKPLPERDADVAPEGVADAVSKTKPPSSLKPAASLDPTTHKTELPIDQKATETAGMPKPLDTSKAPASGASAVLKPTTPTQKPKPPSLAKLLKLMPKKTAQNEATSESSSSSSSRDSDVDEHQDASPLPSTVKTPLTKILSKPPLKISSKPPPAKFIAKPKLPPPPA